MRTSSAPMPTLHMHQSEAAASLLDEARADDRRGRSPSHQKHRHGFQASHVGSNAGLSGLSIKVSSGVDDPDGKGSEPDVKTTHVVGAWNSTAASTKKGAKHVPTLPLTFIEPQGLEGQSLPVRLGLAPPTTAISPPPPKYYLCSPPPSTSQRGAAGASANDLSHATPGAASRNCSTPSEDWGATDQQWEPSQYFRYEHITSRGRRRVRKWHAYDSVRAPWYFSYDPEVLQADMLLHGLTVQSMDRLTIYPFQPDQLPSRVLDVGCGVGIWTTETAAEWKKTEFIGMDLVPIQTSMSTFDDPDLGARVSWVVANFLEEWPFPDASFDFVHLRYIDQGVPEDAWDHVLSEAVRVAAPGAVIEVVTAPFALFTNPRFMPASEMVARAMGTTLATAQDTEAAVEGIKKTQQKDSSIFKPAYEPIKFIFAKMDNRRFINTRSASVVPGALLTHDVVERKQTLMRQFPIKYHHDSYMPFSEEPITCADGIDRRYTTGSGQSVTMKNCIVDAPLKIDNDIMRAIIIWTNAAVRTASTDLAWEEAEREKAEEPRPRGLTSAASAKYRNADLDANLPFIHPWSSRADFEKDMDAYNEDLRSHAGVDAILRRLLGWREGCLELVREGRKQAERKRMLSASPASKAVLSSRPNQQAETLNSFHARGRAASEGKTDQEKAKLLGRAEEEETKALQPEELIPIFGFREVGSFIQRRAWT
ncbi:hypothetical protein K437DRAFT_33283 [Tilletiaria anomala UBC 951]|uniref:Methyltransferase domain-containing protein n=1 Tax=Tilletiaria anomala (strain ATCC 24038 / CBS 436.72 / UBC 951) TaxID=1037660 RepID=A0A066WEF8_TILAU|nr:uncharacterized protein K437DRAFT_33283 [Tilletiaria anomala UBC 951]KDN52156.1 hypothetical protein K437DRAFT_33283 [Tilletiaria anomala UBC 951]